MNVKLAAKLITISVNFCKLIEVTILESNKTKNHILYWETHLFQLKRKIDEH